jgi:hypothetical protein
MTTLELKKYKGKILTRNNINYTWMFKLVDVDNCGTLLVTQGMDIFPQPRAYHGRGIKDFNKIHDEINGDNITIPTKEEMKLYRKYTREIILLGTNKSEFGTK